MEIVHGSKLAFTPTSLPHRSSRLSFKIFFEGSDSDPANNYQLALVSQSGSFCPVQNYNFDQIQYAWQGNFSMSPGSILSQGELAYHPEGVDSGPQNNDAFPKVLYLLQFGGASGQGYLSSESQRQASIELEGQGEFRGGRYHPHDGGEPIDGFQALWEHANGGKKLMKPSPRYRAPIVMTPENFAWKRLQITDMKTMNAWHKLLGVFTERGTVIQMIKLGPLGHVTIVPQDAVQFLLVRSGLAMVNGQGVMKESVVRLLPGVEGGICSEIGVELLHYIVPIYRDGGDQVVDV